MDLVTLINGFSNEESARNLMHHLKWPNGRECPACRRVNLSSDEANGYRCSCGEYFSLKSHSIMQGSRTPISVWLQVLYLVSLNPKMTSRGLASMLGVQRRTGYHLLRKATELISTEQWPSMLPLIEFDQPSKSGR